MIHYYKKPWKELLILMESFNFSGNQFNFQKYTTRTIDSLRTPYDFRSMMHYGSTAFGGGRMTIQTIDSRNQKFLGQRGGFSSIDIQQINKMYCCKLIVNIEQTKKLLKSFWLKLLGNFDLNDQKEIRDVFRTLSNIREGSLLWK